MRCPSLTLGIVASLAFATSTAMAADVEAGKVAFKKCALCHTTEPGKNKIGPSLFGVVGRKAGTLPGYSFSRAMANSGIVWGPDTLPHYLMGPSSVVPGTKMTFAGFSNPQQADDMTAYLATLK